MGSVQSSEWVPKFNMKNLKKAEGCISWNVVSTTMKMKLIKIDKNYQASSQKFKPIFLIVMSEHCVISSKNPSEFTLLKQVWHKVTIMRGKPEKCCSSNAMNNLTSKKQKVCSLCCWHVEIRRRKGSKRCDLFYGGEQDKPTWSGEIWWR